MKPLLVIALLLGLTEFATAGVKPVSPDVLDRELRKELAHCTRQVVKDAGQSGGLVVPGLKACYEYVKNRWDTETAPIFQRLMAVEGSDCAEAARALLAEWEQYSERVEALPAVQSMPINTDDDLRLALRKHLYQLALTLSQNDQCPK